MGPAEVDVDPLATALGAKVADGMAALRRADPRAAATLFDEVWADPAFQAAGDLDDVRARVS